jgi:hypothetical protein
MTNNTTKYVGINGIIIKNVYTQSEWDIGKWIIYKIIKGPLISMSLLKWVFGNVLNIISL